MKYSVKISNNKKSPDKPRIRIQYWDGKTARCLNQQQCPELGSVKSVEDAQALCDRLNVDIEIQSKKLTAIENKNLNTQAFQFDYAVSEYLNVQVERNKSLSDCEFQVKYILSKIIHIEKLDHPANFTRLAYKRVFGIIKKERNLSKSTLHKYRETFNHFLNILSEMNPPLLSSDHVRLVPMKTIYEVEKDSKNTHSQDGISLGRNAVHILSQRVIKKKKVSVENYSYEQLCHLVDYAEKNPDKIDPLLAKAYFIEGIVSYRRGCFLALRICDIEDLGEKMYCHPKYSIQQYRSKGEVVLKIEPPDPIKSADIVPVICQRARSYIREWVDYARRYDSTGNDSGWLFPSMSPWGIENFRPGDMMINPRTHSKRFLRYCQVAGLPRMPLKNLRHTGLNIVKDLAEGSMGQKKAKALAKMISDHSSEKMLDEHYLKPNFETLFALGKLLVG